MLQALGALMTSGCLTPDEFLSLQHQVEGNLSSALLLLLLVLLSLLLLFVLLFLLLLLTLL